MPYTLRPFQQHGVDFLSTRKRAAIFDVMGLGKTPQAIMALRRRGLNADDRVLIIAPLATALGWKRELTRWWPDCPHDFAVPKRKDPVPSSGIVFIAWTDLAVRTELREGPLATMNAVVIADEVHRAKGGTGVKMSKAFTGAWKKAATAEAWVREHGIVDRADAVWMLTGTPMPNGRPIELLPLFMALGIVGNVRCLMKRAVYERTFCYSPNKWVPQGFDLQGRRDIDDLAELMRASGVILRRTPEDVRGELPELVRSIIPLAGIKDPADPALREAAAKLGPGALPPLEEMSAYRRDLGLVKAAPAAAWVLEHLSDQAEGAALVVFVHHKAVGRAIQEALLAAGLEGIEFACGDDSAVDRQAKVDRFSAPTGPRVFLGTTEACGTGMNGLHVRTVECVFVECEWSPHVLDQAEGRIRRMGGIAAVQAIAYYLAAADCLDMYIVQTVDDKRDVIWQALDADEGGRAEAPPERAPTPAPTAAPAPLGVDALPEPSDPSVRWSWAKDRASGTWLLRNCHHLDASAQAAWAGAEVTVTTAAGKQQVRTLVACRYTGPANGGWCIWTHTDPVSAGAKHRDSNLRFVARMLRRGQDPELLCALQAGGSLDDAGRSQAEACAAASRHLTGLDRDHAALRNDEGWSAADVTVGRLVASIDPEFWTQATLVGAQAILRRYRNTQLPANLVDAIWPPPMGRPAV
jgi:superfamily II DNA or RNA helicase